MLYKTLSYLIIIFLLFSCNRQKESASDELRPLNASPIRVKLNTEEGYIINPVTGDSIQPIVNSFGDTLKTGVPVPVIGKVTDPGSAAKPKVVPAGKPKVVPAHLNVHKIPEALTIIPVDKGALKTFTPGVDTSSFVLVNSTGDTVPTGVPMSVQGKIVPCIQPQPVKALSPNMKDNASINMKYLGTKQGMNFVNVYSILEDRHGNLWIGTIGGGVSMYNGETFTHYTIKEGLSSNDIRSILEDSHGNLWFGTGLGGVSMYDGETFTHFTEKEGLSNNKVRSILEDSDGNIWFGTEGGGVSMYNGETLTHYTIKEGLSNNIVRSILEDRHGILWFGTYGGGLSMYNGETFRHFTEKEGLTDNIVRSIVEDPDGILWFGTDGGVSMYNGETITQFTQKEGLCNNRVFSMMLDSHGNLWIATNSEVSMYNGLTFRHFTQKEGLLAIRVHSIMEDSHGNIWFGTSEGGLNLYNGGTFQPFNENEVISNALVQSILEDSDGNLWFGTGSGGVVMYDGRSFNHFTEKEGLVSNHRVRSILEDRHGNLWFGSSRGGVCKYNGKTFTHFTQKQGFILNSVKIILEDRHGNLWFGTWGEGMSMYDGETFTYFTEKEGFSSNYINSILEDRHGNLWFGTGGGGVSNYDGENFTHYTTKEGLRNNGIWSILEDRHGNLWFGTGGGGVSKYDGETFTHFTENEGLTKDWVRSLIEDNDGNIWLSTHKGLHLFVCGPESVSTTKNSLAASELKKYGMKASFNNPVIYTYNPLDGIRSGDFNLNSVILDSKNRIWWGCYGLTMLDMNYFTIPVEPPSVQLNRIDIKEQFADYRHLEESAGMGMKFNGVAKFYNYPLNLKLPYSSNHLTFHFSATDWSAPHKKMYSYKMEGLGDNWSVPTADAKADYRSLPHGTYTFNVRAIGAAQEWSEPFEYTFTIGPPWWLSWWAYSIYGSMIVGILLLYRRYLLNRAKLRTAVEIERIEKEKVQELDHMKTRFFANISHEFRTPLTLILGPLEKLEKPKSGTLSFSWDLLAVMRRNAVRLQHLINQLLDISKLETGKVKLQVSQGNLTEFIRTIVLSFLSLAESKNITYEYDLPEIPSLVYFDRDKVEKILVNLISNAFKFTDPGGSIQVKLIPEFSPTDNLPEYIEVKVSDSGKGIAAENLEKVFDRFYQVGDSDTGKEEGTGIGLALTKELVDLYRGEIHVESEVDMGSVFSVRLPVSKEQFSEEEIVAVIPGEKADREPVEPVIDLEETKPAEIEKSQVKEEVKGAPVILIVEDNIDLRNYISGNLGDSYQILVAENGKQGLEQAAENIPDLVISDVMMPVMDGMEMCTKLKQDERTNHIPVIILTAKADRGSKMEGLGIGADDYITKPFDAEELQVRVKNLIEQRKKLRERFRKEFLTDPAGQEIPAPEDEFMVRVMDCMKKHLTESDFNVEQLGKEMGLSRTQLYRKIIALTDHTPSELIRNTRLRMAARMFMEGHKNVTRVMLSVGFDTSVYFAQYFRELFGLNPSEYIKQKAPSRI